MFLRGGFTLVRPDDYVAEWGDGRGACTEQPVDEADGHRPQGAPPPRIRRTNIGFHGQDTQSVSYYMILIVISSSSTSICLLRACLCCESGSKKNKYINKKIHRQ